MSMLALPESLVILFILPVSHSGQLRRFVTPLPSGFPGPNPGAGTFFNYPCGLYKLAQLAVLETAPLRVRLSPGVLKVKFSV